MSASEASLPVDNKAFRYGLGLFETMLVLNGAIELQSYHAERLFSGAARLGLKLSPHSDEDWLRDEVLRTVRKNKLERLCRVRLQIHPGSGGLFENLNAQSEYIIECFPLDEQITRLNENGLVLGMAEGLQKSPDSLANLKTSAALIYAGAARQAKENGWNDALILNTSGNIIESTIANIFWIKDAIIYTPPLSEGCIAGVMRRKLLTDLPRVGFVVREAILSKAALAQADEVFLTNAIRRIKWVAEISGQKYPSVFASKIYGHLFDNH